MIFKIGDTVLCVEGMTIPDGVHAGTCYEVTGATHEEGDGELYVEVRGVGSCYARRFEKVYPGLLPPSEALI